MLKYVLLYLSACGIVQAVELGVINVNAQKESQEETKTFLQDVFEEPDYLENAEYINAMPSQKRITTQEAMFIPGVQGDPIKAVQSLSGVTSVGDSSGELFIYGSKPEESLTTINHLPIGYLFHMGGLHSVIAPDAIEQIDAYMAGFDVTYGNAMGGVINITPKYPGKDFSGYGHMGIYDSSAGVNVPLNDSVSFFLGARRSYFDLVLGAVGKATGTLDEDTNTSYTEFPNYYDLTFITKYQPNSNDLYSIELISAGDSLNISSQANEVKDPEATGQIKAKYGFTTLGVRHQGFYNDYESNTLAYHKRDTQRAELFAGYYLDIDNYESGIYHQSSLSLDSHKLIAGVELQNFQTPLDMNISTPPNPENPDYDFTTEEKFLIKDKLNINALSAFAEDIYSLTQNTKMRYGVRYSYTNYNDFGGYIDPRFSLLYALDTQNNISFSTGIYSQVPEGFKIIKDLGNPHAGYERAYHYVVHYDTNVFENISWSIDGFAKRYISLLIEDDANRYENAGEGYAYGVDTNLKYRDERYYAFLAYTYLQSKRELNTLSDNRYRFYGEIPHTLQLIGGVKFWQNWALSTRVNYHSGAPYTKVIGTYDDAGRIRPIYEDPFNSRLPDYFSLNVKIAQEIKYADNTSLEWSFEIMNLTNHENISEIKYDDNYNQTGTYKQLPLLPWFDVTYRF